MIVNLVYLVAKLIFRILIWVLPVEFINRLFWLMPGRLVVDILKWYGADIQENVKIMPPILFHNFKDRFDKPFENLHIGANSFIGRDCFLDLIGKIVLEENITLAMGVTLVTHMNVGNSSIKEQFPTYIKDIVVRRDAYIGARVTVIAPVEIGSGALIGAGSLVIHDIPSHTLSAGVPAKTIRSLADI
jgi:acetyltransferase-like isoleucine patch superfamily enzyme